LAPVGVSGFNGAAPRGARNTAKRFAVLRRVLGFNGAAPRGARNRAERRGETLHGGRLQRGRATGGAESGGHDGRGAGGVRFNGAAPRGARNRTRRQCRRAMRNCFNGAAPRGARNSVSPTVVSPVSLASTGPRHGGRGISDVTPDACQPSARLQRGRATGGAESVVAAFT